MTQLAVAAKDALRERYGHKPDRTYMAGISNGGYLVRWQLENRPELYDGGVDWEGTLFTPDGPEPVHVPADGGPLHPGPGDAEDMYAAGFAPRLGGAVALPPDDLLGTDPEGLPGRVRSRRYDPACPGATAGTTLPELLAPCPSDTALRRLVRRPASHSRRTTPWRAISLTGKIKKPLLTLHGTLDTLLPISTDSDVYAEMIADQHRDRLHRYYRIEGGNHVDSLVGLDPERLRPMLPCFRTAFDALTAWVEDRQEPPASATVPRPAGNSTDPALLNTCSLGSGG